MKEQSTAGEGQSSSGGHLSESKSRKLIDVREKIIKELDKLMQREVSLNDEDIAKEQRCIIREEKLKASLIAIEKKLHKNGLLSDVDDQLQAFYSDASISEIAVSETGNELLNQRLTRILSEKIKNKEPTITLSYEELIEVMKDVRTKQGPSTNIPDPERESAAFLERLEHTALVVARARKSFISRQFLDGIDDFVPKSERILCIAPPELSEEMKKQLSDNPTAAGVADEVFRMEILAAGKWEQEHPVEVAPGEDVDDIVESDGGSDENEEVEDEVEDEEDQCGASLPSSSRSHSPITVHSDDEQDNVAKAKAPDEDVPHNELAKNESESCVSSSSAPHEETVEVVADVPSVARKDVPSVAWKKGMKRSAEALIDKEVEKCAVDAKEEAGGDCVLSSGNNTALPPCTDDEVTLFSDSDVECIAIEDNSVAEDEAISTKRSRLGKQDTTVCVNDSNVVDIIQID